ncbi:TRAP transporter solute receptor, TAXI family [Caldalkalibacillus thermarum TA2.A1]|uniref:TAXI family TRAP transporter solute-binding subunit n=1 Tax=Caldalkalibacillus thermarum (strain TA2.A1) TaxID=986075 RepID=F5L923_CALTT|nr:TAXI family TRAP transporter solute-binding subunit [Caldalkalibacillus thermarum]EGL82197.1 TRAP transporter solute receptor, TAXI family [Caldalkalibacillus thermarum TA2.A1]QZT33091.1 TAXI family TRAP transporter solute-binding subunit [Caldalkalibacillus thermarum TA2.A1]
MLNRKFGLLVLLLALALVMTACGTAQDDGQEPEDETNGDTAQEAPQEGIGGFYVMGTGSTGGTYYPLGQEMVNVWNNHIDANFDAVASGASVENLSKIGTGEFDLGMTVHIPALEAYNGEGEFADGAVTNFAFIGHIYPEVLQIVVREASGIESIEDLRGKRVAIGPPGSGTQAAAKLVLEAYGIGDGDYEAFEEGFGDARDRLQDGTIDASFGLLGLPNAGIEELQASAGDVKLLEISPEALEYIEANSGYEAYTIPAGTYNWINEDVTVVSAYAILVANTDTVNDDLAYELARVMIEHADENTHPQSDHTTLDNALLGSEGLPIHPGAERYYREQGILD